MIIVAVVAIAGSAAGGGVAADNEDRLAETTPLGLESEPKRHRTVIGIQIRDRTDGIHSMMMMTGGRDSDGAAAGDCTDAQLSSSEHSE